MTCRRRGGDKYSFRHTVLILIELNLFVLRSAYIRKCFRISLVMFKMLYSHKGLMLSPWGKLTIFHLWCIDCPFPYLLYEKVSLSGNPLGKWIPPILIKAIVLSREIKDCTFKLSITQRLSGLNRPNDSNLVLQFTAHSYLTSFHLGLNLSSKQWSDVLYTGIRLDS